MGGFSRSWQRTKRFQMRTRKLNLVVTTIEWRKRSVKKREMIAAVIAVIAVTVAATAAATVREGISHHNEMEVVATAGGTVVAMTNAAVTFISGRDRGAVTVATVTKAEGSVLHQCQSSTEHAALNMSFQVLRTCVMFKFICINRAW